MLKKMKLKIVPSMVRMGYDIFIYAENPKDPREISVASPVKLEFNEEYSELYSLEPTLHLPMSCDIVSEVSNSFPTETKNLLKQKEKDKNQHIESLENMLNKVLGSLCEK
jgi:hypothetical protein